MEKDRQQGLSEKAHTLLGYMLTIADSQGEVAVTRRTLATAIGTSVPTVGRALRELRDAGELMVVEEGGGRGQATRYRIKALVRDRISMPLGTGGAYEPRPVGQVTRKERKLDRVDPVHDPDHEPESLYHLAYGVGEALVTTVVGLIQGGWKALKRAPVATRVALLGTPFAAGGGILGNSLGSRCWAFLGVVSGALVGSLLAILIPSDPHEEMEQLPATRPTQEGNRPSFAKADPIAAIIRALHPQEAVTGSTMGATFHS